MIKNSIIVLLVIGLVGTGYWGYQEHNEKKAVLINAENNYQRAFNDLAYEMDLLHDKIGGTLAMNSKTSLSPALVEVWRLTDQAHSNVGQLPLTLMPFNETEEFLSNIGDFAYRTAVRDLDKSPLTDQEYKTLNKLYEESSEMQTELRKVQNSILNNDLRWMDVEVALANSEGNQNQDNQIIDGLKTIDKSVKAYNPTEDFGPSFMSLQTREDNYQNLKGRKISEQEAISLAKKYTDITNPADVKVASNSKGSKYGFYSVTLTKPNKKETVNIDLTKKGGYPIYFINNRQIKDANISLNDADLKTVKTLKAKGFNGFELSESRQDDHVAVLTYVSLVNGIRIYPESLKVKVALDNGEIIGFAAEDYFKSHTARNLPSPTISEKVAKSKINPNVEIMEQRLALITNDLMEDVMCYEFLGTINHDTYRIFINAKTGLEEKVERL